MKKKNLKRKSVSKKEIRSAESISLIDYIETTGIGELKKESERYYRFLYGGHDSIVIDTLTNQFFHNATNKSGNPIIFVQYFEGLSFVKAVQKLCKYSNLEQTAVKHRETLEKNHETEPFEIPKFFSKNNEHIFKYLQENRKISKETLEFFFEKELIKEDKLKNLHFILKDNGKKEGVQIGGSAIWLNDQLDEGQSVKGKHILKNSERNFGFNLTIGESPNHLIFFEAPIDLISFYELHKHELNNVRLCSLEGVKQSALMNYILINDQQYHTPIEKISIATDNDRAGIFLYQSMTKIPFANKENQTVIIENLIPNYYLYDQKLQTIYQQVAEKQPLPIEWEIMAGIHKYETNAQWLGEVTNHKRYAKYFEQDGYLSENELKAICTKICQDYTEYGEKDFWKNYSPYSEINKEVKKYTTKSFLQEFQPVQNYYYIKDWNDFLTYEKSSEIERMKISKNEKVPTEGRER